MLTLAMYLSAFFLSIMEICGLNVACPLFLFCPYFHISPRYYSDTRLQELLDGATSEFSGDLFIAFDLMYITI